MSYKITLTLGQTLPFAQNPRFADLEPERILANNVIFAGEFNPHNVRLWVVGNESGPLCAVWADCEQDALDEGVDSDLLGGLLIDPADVEKMSDEEREGVSFLGNAGEPADLEHAWLGVVELEPTRDIKTIIRFAEARGACADNLDK